MSDQYQIGDTVFLCANARWNDTRVAVGRVSSFTPSGSMKVDVEGDQSTRLFFKNKYNGRYDGRSRATLYAQIAFYEIISRDQYDMHVIENNRVRMVSKMTNLVYEFHNANRKITSKDALIAAIDKLRADVEEIQ